MPRARTTAVTASPAGAGETAVATLPGQAIPPGAPVDFLAMIDITLPAGATGLTLRVKRGAAAGGGIVAAYGPEAVTAGTRVVRTIAGTDSQAGEEAGQQYVLTVTVVAAGGASVVNAVDLVAIW